jgi:DNA polymerase-3 subunit epsilon/ATP-dependent DNA helicase DinG
VSSTFVALDLETTGLDPEQDEITEVAAIRFEAGRSAEVFHTLVNPRREVPYRIQLMTGLSTRELRRAPSFAEVASDLERFLGAHSVVGQNVAFDLSFLSRWGVRPAGPAFDTWDLARLLLFDLSDYSLRSLARRLDLEYPTQHRAPADAEAAGRVFVALRERLALRPPAVLAELERLAALADWPLRHLFRELLAEAEQGGARGAPPAAGAVRGLEDSALGVAKVRPGGREAGASLGALGEGRPVKPDEVETLLEGLAGHPEVLPGFERRPEQAAMAGAVAEALSGAEHLIVEAGTGVGKSLAYLLPSACFALLNRTRVLVSTNTISLQEQLLGQDIPIVRKALEGWGPRGLGKNLRVAQLKGRRNYLCLLRWAGQRRAAALPPAEAKLMARLLLWLPHTETGDRAELNLTPEEETVWSRLSAQNEACLASACRYVREGTCFLERARRRAEAAHIVIVNHALLLSDLAAGGRVLPSYSYLVADEAQHLEDEATQQFGFQTSELDIISFLDRVHQRIGRDRDGGLAGSLRQAARGVAAPLGRAAISSLAASLAAAVGRARQRLPDLFGLLPDFVRHQTSEEGDYDQRLLLSRAMRVQPDWSAVEAAWENLDLTLQQVEASLAGVQEALEGTEAQGLLDHEALAAETGDLIQGVQSLREGIAAVIAREDPQRIAWLSLSRWGGPRRSAGEPGQKAGGRIGLASAPLQVADALRAGLFDAKDSVILTSATLSTEGHLQYLRQRVGLEESRELLVGSPFDYARSTLVLVPQDLPEPGEPGYQSTLERAVLGLCRASEGRALVLFTSYAALRATHAAVRPPLEEEGVLVLGHGIDGSPKQLLQALRENPRTVLLGTASFWEGVDVVGEALSLLVMARLPFTVPTDPVFVARSGLYDQPFNQYALPQAVLRFKQGFGRLIRRKTDRGVVVVLDRRVRSRRYGSAFLRSLPPCTVREEPLRNLPRAVADWLAAPIEEPTAAP